MFGNNVPVDGVHVLRGVCRLVVVECRVLGASRSRSCMHSEDSGCCQRPSRGPIS